MTTHQTPAFARIALLGLTALPLLTAAALGGCTPMSEEEAAATWSSVGQSFNSSENSASQALTIDVSASATFNCRRDGTMDVASNLGADAGDGDLTVAFDYDVDYVDCQPNDDILNGSLDYRAALTSERTEDEEGEPDGRETTITYTYDGVILVTDEEGTTRECVVDAQGFATADIEHEAGAEFRASRSIRYEGTICGHDAESVANASVDISVSTD